MRWLWALIAVVVLVALGAFFWPTLHRTIVALHVGEAPAPAPTGQATPPPASVAQTSPFAPPSAAVAQSSPPATAPAPGSQTSPSAPAPPQTPAPAPIAQTAPSAPSPVPAAQAPTPASAGATTGEAAAATLGSGDRAASELASLKPGFGGGDLVSALNRPKFTFATASAEVPAEMADFLKRAADEMKRLPPGHVLEIAGYTDSSGNPARNVTLSQKRAAAVRQALIEAGVNAGTLVAKGYGSADPIGSNDTPEGRLRNRRIEFHVVKTP
jgi:outer membrane protein OmpA-like peptidoglycan-associated protein